MNQKQIINKLIHIYIIYIIVVGLISDECTTLYVINKKTFINCEKTASHILDRYMSFMESWKMIESMQSQS